MSLLIGDNVTLHRNTVCDVSAPGKPYNEARCKVLLFDAHKAKWQVRLRGDDVHDWNGKIKYVPERALSLGFAVLPNNARPRLHVAVLTEGMHGSCGRGLVVQQAVRAGQPIFTESPLMVVATITANPQKQYNERFLAFQSLARAARNDATAAAALEVFEDASFRGSKPFPDVILSSLHVSHSPESQSTMTGSSPWWDS